MANVSACKTFSANQVFDVESMKDHVSTRIGVLTPEGVFTESIRCIFEIDDSEFQPKTEKNKRLITINTVPTLEQNNIITFDDEDEAYEEVITVTKEADIIVGQVTQEQEEELVEVSEEIVEKVKTKKSKK